MRIVLAIFLALAPVGVRTAWAHVVVPPMFSDHMVLQRGMPIPIWGQALPNNAVTVRFRGQEKSGRADASGNWRIELAALKAGGPHDLVISTSSDRITIRDVLVGEVWLGSGQSNMAGKTAGYAKNDLAIAKRMEAGPFTGIRLLRSGPNPRWEVATPETIASFSALLFAFGDRLHGNLKVPVGLMLGAVGGTPSGAWINREAYERSDSCKAAIAKFAQSYDESKAMRSYKTKLAVWEKRAAEAAARGRKPKPPVPPGTSTRGKIGGLYDRYIRTLEGYRIRGVLWDQGEGGTGVHRLDQYTMMGALIEGWREQWGQGIFPFLFVQKPSGGGCAYFPDKALTFRAQPFTAQLPPIEKASNGTQRFEYVRMMNHPNAWMVSVSDLGSGVHPPDKWAYGNRAAQIALAKAYRYNILPWGPRYRKHTIEGDRIRIHFDQLGKGLTAAHQEKLQGFAIAGADRKFVWANARIDRDSVIVWSGRIPKPEAVRYAYAKNRSWANLFNKDGLPALAFDTDG